MSSKKPQKSKRLMALILAATLLVVLALLLLIWRDSLRPPEAPFAIGFPGAAQGDAVSFKLDSLQVRDIKERMLELLQTESPQGLASWYSLAGRIGIPPAVRADSFLIEDQLRYGLFLLEQQERNTFQNWWHTFRTGYLDAEGLAVDYPSGPAAGPSPANWRQNSALLRILAQSNARWPDRQRVADLEKLSDAMLQDSQAGMAADFLAAVPTPAPTLDPAATPTPKPSISPAATPPPMAQKDVLRLASLDLYTMQQAAAWDERWQTLFDRCLPLVEQGYVSDDLPLYYFGYIANPEGYLPFAGEAPLVDTAEALLTVLHLAEIGRDSPRSLNWIKDQVFNQRVVYQSYHITQGHPGGTAESLESYAIIARIARIKGDQALYKAAVDLLLWHQATSARSAARYAIFRQDADGLVKVWAADNTWALLAIG